MPGKGRSFSSAAAVAVLVAAAAAAAFTLVWNYDIFWHLASGRWMLQHGRVLDFDPFSIDGAARWINVHWLFQLVAASLHKLGGFEILTGLKCVLAAAAMLAFALGLRRHVHPAWLIFSGLLMLAVMLPRVRVRPEAFTLFFLTVTIVLLERVRRGGSPGQLWPLAPMMLAWVNMHGLYILGLGVIWAAMVAAVLDKRLGRGLSGRLATQGALAPVMAATIAVLVSPWPLQSAIQPVLLWSRISGQEIYYTYGVQELQPTWQALSRYPAAIALALLAAAAMIANARAVPIAHVLWLVGFALPAVLARRNVGLLGPVCGYLLAWHGWAVLNRLADRHPRLGRLGPCLTTVAVIAAVAATAGYATGWIHHARKTSRRFGAGLQGETYPIKTAKFLGELPAGGDIFCGNFGDSAALTYYAHPQRRVWMDGRLEAHSLDRFIQQQRIVTGLRTRQSADTIKLPETVRFVVIHHDSPQQLTALANSRRFSLVYVDDTVACFARQDWLAAIGRTPVADDLPARSNIADFDLPLGRDNLIAGIGDRRRTWYRRNPHSLSYQRGSMLGALGRRDKKGQFRKTTALQRKCTLLAVRYLTAAAAENVVPVNIAIGSLALAYQQRALQCDAPPADAPAEINSARALHLYRQLDLTNLADRNTLMFAVQKVRALLQARQLDAAAEAMKELLANLPAPQRINPPRKYLSIRDTISAQLAAAQLRCSARQIDKLGTSARVAALTAPDVGLIERAIAELRTSGMNRTILGDLLLRRGDVAAARQAYAGQDEGVNSPVAIPLRLALCDWAEGKLFAAHDALEALASEHDIPLVIYYRDLLSEELGV